MLRSEEGGVKDAVDRHLRIQYCTALQNALHTYIQKGSLTICNATRTVNIDRAHISTGQSTESRCPSRARLRIVHECDLVMARCMSVQKSRKENLAEAFLTTPGIRWSFIRGGAIS